MVKYIFLAEILFLGGGHLRLESPFIWVNMVLNCL